MKTKHLKLTAVALVLSVGTVWGSAGLVRLHGNMDVDKDGIVSESEFMNLWENNFHQQDKNKDGRLTVDECGGAVMPADKNKDGEVTLAEDQAMRQGHLKNLDKDGDRSLTLAEMTGTAAAPTAKPSAPTAKPPAPEDNAATAKPRLLELHQTMDSNQDSLVSHDEFMASWKASFDQRDKDQNGQLTAVEDGAEMLKLADWNQDGVLTWDEEQQLRQGHFKYMDKDSNQSLTLPEILGSAAKPTASGDVDFAAQRARVVALSDLTAAPVMHRAEGFDSTDKLMAIYYQALDWQGKPTKVFAWLGMPDEYNEDVPAVVLVHGGGGTAFKNWVQEWNARGYAAISIAVEGQVDRKNTNGDKSQHWERHEWAGPARKGIYHDSAQSLQDQWMYHAVADTILANSLIRSIDGVDASRVGIMGISWGGVITSTVIGIDDRFAFAIPTYGCGDLIAAENHYGLSLGSNETYKQVWDPMLRLERAKMPSLWFSWPQDEHFPMDQFAACYGKVAGEHMVALVPEMGHGHGPGWSRPEGYAFADSIVNGQGPWCVQTDASLQADTCKVTFQSTKALNAVMLISTTDRGVSGERTWVETPATVARNGVAWIATATLPTGSTAWFMNVKSGDLIASSDYQQVK